MSETLSAITSVAGAVTSSSSSTYNAYDLVCGVVQNEVGSSMETEAIKAQAVATYTYIRYSNEVLGVSPQVTVKSNVSDKVRNAVREVIGEAVYYNNSLAYTPYFSTSCGSTQASSEVWGGSYAYLVAVGSSWDRSVTGFKTKVVFTKSYIEGRIEDYLGKTPTGDPDDWFDIASYTSGGYVDKIYVAGVSLTGRKVRENLLSLNIRSACFDIEYDDSDETFIFTVYGYGHGVGMSQNGANGMAKEGYTYDEILTHYYKGTTVR